MIFSVTDLGLTKFDVIPNDGRGVTVYLVYRIPKKKEYVYTTDVTVKAQNLTRV